MAPRPPFAALTRAIAAELGDFNAVHIRRGDFKHTNGVTTRDRTAADALAVMDRNFKRKDRLVILTDERSDPFFDGILEYYPDSIFIDEYILERFGEPFRDLPFHDSIALAFLSQLVASGAKDFIGSMTSTFSAMIQRYLGSKGLHEPFKFLWNEIPDDGDDIEPGRHRFSECVPMKDGVMIEEFEGPYSWNRYNQRIIPSWMREWPESFLMPAAGNGTSRLGSPMPRPWEHSAGQRTAEGTARAARHAYAGGLWRRVRTWLKSPRRALRGQRKP